MLTERQEQSITHIISIVHDVGCLLLGCLMTDKYARLFRRKINYKLIQENRLEKISDFEFDYSTGGYKYKVNNLDGLSIIITEGANILSNDGSINRSISCQLLPVEA